MRHASTTNKWCKSCSDGMKMIPLAWLLGGWFTIWKSCSKCFLDCYKTCSHVRWWQHFFLLEHSVHWFEYLIIVEGMNHWSLLCRFTYHNNNCWMCIGQHEGVLLMSGYANCHSANFTLLVNNAVLLIRQWPCQSWSKCHWKEDNMAFF